jgi:predicted RNA-binding Zn-ribbon protein involved in translation (DUF1610 family)
MAAPLQHRNLPSIACRDAQWPPRLEGLPVMTERRQILLEVMDHPSAAAVIAAVTAPPVLEASSHTIDYACGRCGTVLMHADKDQVHGVFVRCAKCGSYNATES